MQDYPTIIGIIDMRLRGISYEDCCGRYKVGHSTVTRIMSRYKELDKTLEELKQMAPAEVENKFYPPENVRRKDESIMPDFAARKQILELAKKLHERMLDEQYRNFFHWMRADAEYPTLRQYQQDYRQRQSVAERLDRISQQERYKGRYRNRKGFSDQTE